MSQNGEQTVWPQLQIQGADQPEFEFGHSSKQPKEHPNRFWGETAESSPLHFPVECHK